MNPSQRVRRVRAIDAGKAAVRLKGYVFNSSVACWRVAKNFEGNERGFEKSPRKAEGIFLTRARK
jgi:hypothetical protein